MIPGVRAAEMRAFLARSGWGEARRAHLAGDASARRYERLALGDARAVFMDAPPGCGDDLGDFLKIGGHLAGLGLSPPATLAADTGVGLALIEDLGDLTYTAAISEDPRREPELLAEAAGVLAHLQRADAPPDLPDLSAEAWADSALFALDWYVRGITGSAPDPQPFRDKLLAALQAHADGPRVLILRDYHAGNLLWLAERSGLARVGLLDYQLGQMGQPGYDLVSLIQDARRDVSPEAETAAVARFARDTGTTPEQLAPQLATLGALRALRILGIFARLCMMQGKPGYLIHLPRVRAQVTRNLAHPALADLRRICEGILPPASPENIARLEALCGTEASR